MAMPPARQEIPRGLFLRRDDRSVGASNGLTIRYRRVGEVAPLGRSAEAFRICDRLCKGLALLAAVHDGPVVVILAAGTTPDTIAVVRLSLIRESADQRLQPPVFGRVDVVLRVAVVGARVRVGLQLVAVDGPVRACRCGGVR